MDEALCAQTDPDAFFVERGESPRPAKKVCRECPVRAECLKYALDNNESFGIWGGTSEKDRRKLKKHRTAPGAAEAQVVPAENAGGRITVSQLAVMRVRREAGELLREIADDYGVSPGQVGKLLAGTKKPVPDPVPEITDAEPADTGSVAA
jgi:WhiB family redox-sensing transcriptional regulator